MCIGSSRGGEGKVVVHGCLQLLKSPTATHCLTELHRHAHSTCNVAIRCTYCMSCVCVCFQDGVWVKVDRILVLSEWLYTHQFPTEDSLGHLKWALTLLLDTGGEREREEEGEDGEEEEQAEPECGVGVREKAVQILVMMARLQGRGSGGHRESCLAALAHCYLLWKVRQKLCISPEVYIHTSFCWCMCTGNI